MCARVPICSDECPVHCASPFAPSRRQGQRVNLRLKIDRMFATLAEFDAHVPCPA